jgi:hypothetical protein
MILDHILDILKIVGVLIACFLGSVNYLINVAIATIKLFVGKIKQFCCTKYKGQDEKNSVKGNNLYDSFLFERANSNLPSTRLNQNNAYNQSSLYRNISISYVNNRIVIDEKVFKIDAIASSDWNDFNNDYFYHYTSLNCAIQILQIRRLIASKPKVKRFGKNVYFTKCKPDSNDYQIVTNNYIYYSMAYLSNIQCAFAFHKNHLILNKVYDKFARDIWRHADDIDLNRIDFKVIIR